MSAFIGGVLAQAASVDKKLVASIRKLIMVRTSSADKQIEF
jgi:hypothetical protein